MMKKETKKSNEAQLLDVLKRVLPKATHDAKLADKIYQAIEVELKARGRVMAFEKFCGGIELPNLEQKTVADVKLQLAASFGDGDITLKRPIGIQCLHALRALLLRLHGCLPAS